MKFAFIMSTVAAVLAAAMTANSASAATPIDAGAAGASASLERNSMRP